MNEQHAVVVTERGVPAVGLGPGTVLLQQRASENARQFAQRVAERLGELRNHGVHVERASLQLSTARGSSSTARRFSLARVMLAQLPEAELRLEGPLGQTEEGRLDVEALAETLRLFDSRTTVTPVRLAKQVAASTGFWPRAA